jgi:glycosyltransferase involved in cell wall biosynthesis
MQTGNSIKHHNSFKKDVLVSVVCVTLNAAKTLEKLIRSVAGQKTNSVEFVVIDGNSTDGTIDILKKNSSVVDFWISEPDNGIYDAMNKSLSYINGKWVIFLGADDHLADDFKNILPMLKDLHTIYYGNVIFYGKKFAKEYDDYYLTKLNICHQGIFYPRAVFKKYCYETKYKVYADYHLNLKCWKDEQFTFSHCDFVVASFEEGGFSAKTKDPAFESDINKLFKQYLRPTSYYRYLNRTLGVFGMLKFIMLNI